MVCTVVVEVEHLRLFACVTQAKEKNVEAEPGCRNLNRRPWDQCTDVVCCMFAIMLVQVAESSRVWVTLYSFTAAQFPKDRHHSGLVVPGSSAICTWQP